MTNPSASLPARAFLIDPVCQKVFEIDEDHFESLIVETVGEDSECIRLDTADNVVWVSNTDTNSRYGYHFEGMDFPLNVRRFSKAVVVGLGDHPWDADTIGDYLRWYDTRNVWGDL